ncbi:malto-oligosyltrehalose synthase [Pyrobaculum aerophilum]|uniref:Malto-oligosyltrehalose synthase n=1 Tax=Pyrobaculum aerophilum TaxID=13773 RepID=A0A371R2U8_9CREN|nr:malto-oligosyltrehalose synthase [Pyrobaculum aerophilum]RFA97640.1 malto-oligosyltrehalose synthase [Pyrobaculum aerophilum]RFA98074.1 malto-oligosyltrehalose synthase [Pyrobaculum aerophilum]
MIRATYRLQLNKDFTFYNVIENLDYFKELGISHLYLSPILKARPGSTHGYDVVDHSKINEELGGEEGYYKLVEEARKRGIGIIQDVVPNHMAIHHTNWRLMDLLRNWKKSRYYHYFDHYGEDKLVLPILEGPLEELIDKGLLKVENGHIIYRELKFPINDEGLKFLKKLGCPAGTCLTKDNLFKLLSLQYYELKHWKEYPNYRRFFAINDLIAVRVELEEVFKESHEVITKLPVDGLRIDHIDGLYDPHQYINKLREAIGNKLIYVEKILALEESLPRGWRVDGTTGYDFLNYVNLLLVDGTNEHLMTEIYEEFIGKKLNVDRVVSESKRLVINTLFKGDVERLAKMFGIDYEYLVEFLVCMKRYRTYIPYENLDTIKECDKEGKLKDVNALRRLQQYMPAVFAKGYEDTALFRYNRLISLNEVGSELQRFSISLEEFHNFNRKRVGSLTLNATSTHDTKFSEDVRAKISVLSELPHEWRERVRYWHDLLKPRIDPNDEYRFYQTLLGSFYEGFSDVYINRLKNHMIKVLREAKERSSWESPNLEYEQKMLDFIDDVVSNTAFKDDFIKFERKIRPYGFMKSLVMVTIKITSPGVPDFYQGTEVWRFLLTDPDNRAPVDFAKLKRLIKELPDSVLKLDISDERTKMLFIKKLLGIRDILSGYEALPYGFRRGDVIVLFSPIVTREREDVVKIPKSFDILRNVELQAGEYKLSELIGEHKVAVLITK